MASREMARRGLGNVRLIQSDGLHQGITDQTFDFVHERLVLVNLPNPESLVSELVRLVRPGGTVALEDIDNVSWVCHPANQSWDVLLDAFLTAFQASGGHPFIGRRLGELLGNGGVQGIQIQAHATTAPPGGYRRGHLLALIGALREKIIGLRLLTESELETHLESLRQHLNDPRTVVIDKLLIQAWGKKP